jgi:hypothetical protein
MTLSRHIIISDINVHLYMTSHPISSQRHHAAPHQLSNIISPFLPTRRPRLLFSIVVGTVEDVLGLILYIYSAFSLPFSTAYRDLSPPCVPSRPETAPSAVKCPVVQIICRIRQPRRRWNVSLPTRPISIESERAAVRAFDSNPIVESMRMDRDSLRDPAGGPHIFEPKGVHLPYLILDMIFYPIYLGLKLH